MRPWQLSHCGNGTVLDYSHHEEVHGATIIEAMKMALRLLVYFDNRMYHFEAVVALPLFACDANRKSSRPTVNSENVLIWPHYYCRNWLGRNDVAVRPVGGSSHQEANSVINFAKSSRKLSTDFRIGNESIIGVAQRRHG